LYILKAEFLIIKSPCLTLRLTRLIYSLIRLFILGTATLALIETTSFLVAGGAKRSPQPKIYSEKHETASNKIYLTKTVIPKASYTSLFHSKNLFQISKFFRNFADYYSGQSEIAKTDIDNKTIKSKTMPKLKTKSGAKKRFALTGSGKIKRKNAYKSHILTKKETKQKRNLTTTSYVAAVDEKSVLRQLAIK